MSVTKYPKWRASFANGRCARQRLAAAIDAMVARTFMPAGCDAIQIEALETRRLMYASPSNFQVEPLSVISSTASLSPHEGPFVGTSVAGSVPALSSDPDATAEVFLDFNGAPAMSWGSYKTSVTPAYDTDGDAATFTAGELANIQEIWARVSEMYSPFNINVTTVDPGNLTDQETTRVVIGGNGSWYGSAGGVAYVGAFYNTAPNIAWVFPKMLANGNPKYTAEAATHEAGHTFGLQHQSSYSGTTKTADYNPGNPARAPIMGNSYGAARALWWNGPSTTSTTIQNDVSVLSNSYNGFGYRPDDHGGAIGSASALDISDDAVSGLGIIEQLSDKDYFSFSTLAGEITLSVSPAQYAGMLDATLTLMDGSGTILTSADTASMGESMSASVGTGTYYLVVGSEGNAGDLGQYTISGTIITSPDYVARPAGLTATAGAGAVNLNWTDKSGNENGFIIERSSDGGSTWSQIGTAGQDATSYTDSTVSIGSAYKYRVKATGLAQDSSYSVPASVSVLPSPVDDFTATSVSASQIDLSWTDVSGETGYRIDRSTNGTTWSTLTTVSSNVTAFSSTGLGTNTKYYYRIVSLSGIGNSAPSSSSATTTPAAPTTLTGTVTVNSITLNWTNVAGETGYRIESSGDGVSWSQLAMVGANVVSYKNLGLSPNTKVYYRVRAIGIGGDSTPAASIARTTLLTAPTDLYAFGATATSLKISWADLNAETGYRLERLSGTKWVQVGSDLSANMTIATVTGLSASTIYTFRVTALNDGGVSAPSASVKGTTVPIAPAKTTATALSETEVKLAWTNVATEAGYRIERSSDGGSTWAWVGSARADATSFTDTILHGNTGYSYRVRAYSEWGTGGFGPMASTTTLLGAPSGLNVTSATATSLDLAWTSSAGATGYRLERLTLIGWVQVGANLAADATSVTVGGLTGGAKYTFRLRALNAGGASAPGSSLTASTKPATAKTLRVSASAADEVRMDWAAVIARSRFYIQRTTGGKKWIPVRTFGSDVMTFLDTGRKSAKYTFRIHAKDPSGTSPASGRR